MPNTLVHLGVQTLISKGCWRNADFKWIAVGCIIPDLPWILQRAVYALIPSVNITDLHLYTLIQAALFFSFLLCGAISLHVRGSARIFFLLAGNCLLHLLLDALQTKWANGVHLLAPFSWQLTEFHLFWPEQAINYLLSLLGLATLFFFGIKEGTRLVFFTPSRIRLVLSTLLAGIYFLTPPLFFQGPLEADNHFLTTLRDKNTRPGRYVEFDRTSYDPVGRNIQLLSGEVLKVTGLPVTAKKIVSLQGTFIDKETVQAQAYHFHSPLRDISSLVGLSGILLVWLVALLRKRCIVDPQ